MVMPVVKKGTSRTAIWKREVKETAFQAFGNKCIVCGINNDLCLHFNKDENGKPYTIGYAKLFEFNSKYAYVICGTCQRTMWVMRKTIEQMKERLASDSEFAEMIARMQHVRKESNDRIKEEEKKSEEFEKKLHPGGKRERL